MTGAALGKDMCSKEERGEDLTICTVSFNSATYLRYNQTLTRRLNKSSRVRWIVAENSPVSSPERFEMSEPGFDVVEGAGPGHTPTFHHTLALRECVLRSETRFVLVLDPDLFVLRPQWIEGVIKHMQEHRLAIFGTPWHPQSRGKYRYFPTVHFSLFDTLLFDRAAIDFRPSFPNGKVDPDWPQGWDADKQYFATSPFARALARVPVPFLRQRRQYYTDTGSRLYKHHIGDSGLRFELLDPVYDRHRDLQQFSPLGRLLERLLPDELCYLPKHYPPSRGSFLAGFSRADVLRHWEQFTWRADPFCFHVRRNAAADNREAGSEVQMVGSVLAAWFGQLSGIPADLQQTD